MSSATQTVNYFVSKKPSSEDQDRLNRIDEILPQLSQDELWEAIFAIASAYAEDMEKYPPLLEKFDILSAALDDEDLNIAIVKALVTYLKRR